MDRRERDHASSWRAICEALHARRRTFTEATESSRPEDGAPPKPLFHVQVGCRFRPAGDDVAQREVVLPLHQKLQLIQSAHKCSRSEACKRLWSSAGASDPWASAQLEESA